MASYSSNGTRALPSPRTGAQKGVTIYDEPEHIEPVKVSDYDAATSPTLVPSHPPRIHRASISGKKMTGRPALPQSASSASLVNAQMSNLSLDGSGLESGGTPNESKTPDLRTLLSQVVDWLQEEKSKRQRRRHRLHHLRSHLDHHRHPAKDESPSIDYDSPVESEADLSLERLENILSGFTSYLPAFPRPSHKSSSSLLRKGSIARKYKRTTTAPQSSDTEFFGEDILVPSVEAYLDNSKTMAFTGGTDADTSDSAKRRDYVHWVKFKEDILRLTHTLKLKGWRRIPIDRAQDIDVARLSGALTNAVYVVRPPKNMSDYDQHKQSDSSAAPSRPVSKRQPVQLLLRIYGPQVEHLIDRQAELNILRRLARKRIGPRLLGSFDNGRFEEYLHAQTLTAEDLRVPETSKQIAKRMRELHDGIELLESEVEAGPAVFINWDKWVDRCEKIITWLDQQVYRAQQEAQGETEGGLSVVNPRYVRRGLICGVEWPVFRRTYEAYRKRVIADCGGMDGIRRALVFAHNDTQYGNLMRLEPSGQSPLLQPSNQHKQLVVIDFEYASPNTRGLEFANHFTEWCYNYHHPERSYVCDTRRYPDESEQHRFVRSYVMHRPQFNPAASATPSLEPREKTNISDFMLDARTPVGAAGGGVVESDYEKEEKEREKAQEEEIQLLLRETRIWRMANSAQWVAWGIVQAKIPELEALQKEEEEEEEKRKNSTKARAGAVVDRFKEMTRAGVEAAVSGWKGETKEERNGRKLHPMSDPLDDEEKRLQQESQHDRPESRFQEEAHHEGDGGVVVPHEAQREIVADTEEGEADVRDVNGLAVSEGETPGTTVEPAIGDAEVDDTIDNPIDNTPTVHTTLDPGEDEHEEFDYLAYAQERAMLFWGDCVQMGLVKEEELPEDLRRRIKIVPY